MDWKHERWKHLWLKQGRGVYYPLQSSHVDWQTNGWLGQGHLHTHKHEPASRLPVSFIQRSIIHEYQSCLCTTEKDDGRRIISITCAEAWVTAGKEKYCEVEPTPSHWAASACFRSGHVGRVTAGLWLQCIIMQGVMLYWFLKDYLPVIFSPIQAVRPLYDHTFILNELCLQLSCQMCTIMRQH